LLTFGNPNENAIAEGLHFKVPFAQSVVYMDIQTQKYNADASAASKDLQTVSTKIAVNYHLTENVVSLYREIGLDYESKIIQPAVQEVVKASTSQFTAEELITKRKLVKQKIDENLKARLDTRGIIMETTSITNFDFSAQFNAAIEAKVTAEQNALTEKNRLASIEYQAQQQVAQANGTAISTVLNAQAQADAKLAIAKAEAAALELQKNQITSQLLELRSIEVQKSYADKWNGQLPTTVLGNQIPLLQFPSSLIK
jgi:regulator of protease activity HflC (stomatin/prohibitin superfamily)